jgi:DNA-binding beta-propeller fold protein YncE
LAISADFLNQTLSIFDIDKLQPGAKRADVLVGSVDLSKYSPGPLALAVTPDGKTALVSISAGFLGAFITVPPGDGTLLFVDIEKRAVVGELNTGKSPMGIVISPDGKRAFVGQFSESYFSVVDIEKRTFTKVQTGAQYNEELALDDTGTVGILTYGPAGNCKTFSVADPTRVGQTTGLSGDAGGAAFFPGTKIAYLLQAPTTLTLNVGGHNVIDVSDPAKPVASDNVREDSPSMYPVTAVGPRKSIAFPETKDNMLSLTEMKLEGGLAKKVQSVPVGSAKQLAYGVAATPDGRVLLAVPGEHYVGVVDLATQKAFTVPWEVTKSGPNDIKMIP